jgi:hypothetical protein
MVTKILINSTKNLEIEFCEAVEIANLEKEKIIDLCEFVKNNQEESFNTESS